jgi:hypothetical protein
MPAPAVIEIFWISENDPMEPLVALSSAELVPLTGLQVLPRYICGTNSLRERRLRDFK